MKVPWLSPWMKDALRDAANAASMDRLKVGRHLHHATASALVRRGLAEIVNGDEVVLTERGREVGRTLPLP